MTEQKAGLDFEALRCAEEEHVLDSMLALYAEDAQIVIVNRNTPPSSPFELHGKEQIAEHLRDVLGRDMNHQLQNEVIGEDRVAFNIACQYPDGNRVFCAGMLEVRDGKIVREVGVQAWDE